MTTANVTNGIYIDSYVSVTSLYASGSGSVAFFVVYFFGSLTLDLNLMRDA